MTAVGGASAKNVKVLLALLTLLSGCFGQPEDLFVINGNVLDGAGEPWAGATVLLERDDGSTEQGGCTGFQSFVTLTTNDTGSFSHRIIRQQTRGRLSDHRCFRAIVSAPDGRRTTVVWPFTGEDVRVPALKLWQDHGNIFKNSIGFGGVASALPEHFRYFGEGSSPFVYRAQLDTELGRAWRSSPAASGFSLSPRFVPDQAMGARFPSMRVAAVQRIERYDRDPFGQLNVAVFENRLETAPVTFAAQPATLFPTRGLCDFKSADGGCALTDSDPTAVELPPNTRELIIDFGKAWDFGMPNQLHYLYIHRIWVEGPWTGLTVELSVEDTEQWALFDTVMLDKAKLEGFQVSRDDRRPGLDIGDIPLRGRSLGYRRLRIRAVNKEQTVPIKSVGELSLYGN